MQNTEQAAEAGVDDGVLRAKAERTLSRLKVLKWLTKSNQLKSA